MITSRDNPQIKELKKLQEKRFRLRRGKFAAEGEDLVGAALEAGWKPDTIYCAPDAPLALLEHDDALEVDFDLLASASALGSGSRAVAVFDLPEANAAELGQLALYVEGIGDPGNLGTLIRSASAFTDTALLLGPDCADPYSPKALRAAMGATFAAAPAEGPVPANATVVALDGSGTTDLPDLKLSAPIVVCAGSERHGLSKETLERADVVARIPMREDGPESLNVAMAATIALYELAKGIHQPPPN